MKVGGFNIHFSPKKSPSLSGQSEKADYMQNLKDVFTKVTDKLEESKDVPGAFVMNSFQVNSQQFLNIQDISSQFNASAPV